MNGDDSDEGMHFNQTEWLLFPLLFLFLSTSCTGSCSGIISTSGIANYLADATARSKKVFTTNALTGWIQRDELFFNVFLLTATDEAKRK